MNKSDLKKIWEILDTKLKPITKKLDVHDNHFKSISQKLDALTAGMDEVQKKTDAIADIHSIHEDTKEKVEDHEQRLKTLETTA